MAAFITTPYTIILLGLRLRAFHAKPSAHQHPSPRGALGTLGTSLTYQLTRYADDWVITCGSAVEAHVPLAAVGRILKELGVPSIRKGCGSCRWAEDIAIQQALQRVRA